MTFYTIDSPQDPRLEPYRNVRERDLVARNGHFIAEGKVVLNVLLVSKDFEAQSILIMENRLEGLMPLLKSAMQTVPIYVTSAEIIHEISGFHVHRGILAIGKRRHAPVNMLSTLGDNALVIVMAGLSNHDNVGAIFRNAAAFKADAVLLDGESCDPLYRKALRVSVGAVLKVPFVKDGTLTEIIAALQAEGFALAALSPQGTRSITDLPTSGRRALIVGSEGHGLPDAVLAAISTWTIPMTADFDSLNVATASGIALFHASGFAKVS